MPSIISYQKYITPQITRNLNLPVDSENNVLGTELATIGTLTYISLPNGAALPTVQPAEIADSITPVALTDELKEAIRAASPHIALINQRMIEQIRSTYSIDDEMYFARIGVGAATGLYTPSANEMNELTVFGEFVESVRQWGRDKRGELGL